MEDGYISPKRTEIMDACPICGGEIRPIPNDPLNQIYECKDPNCKARRIDPTINIYACTVCGRDTEMFSNIDDHPYCLKHIPSSIIVENPNGKK